MTSGGHNNGAEFNGAFMLMQDAVLRLFATQS
jgi:hypothetical protein